MLVRKAKIKDLPGITELAVALLKYHQNLDPYFIPTEDDRLTDTARECRDESGKAAISWNRQNKMAFCYVVPPIWEKTASKCIVNLLGTP